MKLATIKQIQELRLQAASNKQQASSCKHQAYFNDFKYPEVWYKIWLQGMEEYLETRRKRQASKILDPKDQASSCAQPPSSASSKRQASSPDSRASSFKPQAASESTCCPS